MRHGDNAERRLGALPPWRRAPAGAAVAAMVRGGACDGDPSRGRAVRDGARVPRRKAFVDVGEFHDSDVVALTRVAGRGSRP